jgi:hypothetical protein
MSHSKADMRKPKPHVPLGKKGMHSCTPTLFSSFWVKDSNALLWNNDKCSVVCIVCIVFC